MWSFRSSNWQNRPLPDLLCEIKIREKNLNKSLLLKTTHIETFVSIVEWEAGKEIVRNHPACRIIVSLRKKVWQTAILGMDSLFCSYWVAIQKKQGWCHARNGNGFIYLSAQFLIHGLGPLLDLINCRATHQIVFCGVTKQKKKNVRGIRIFWNFYFSGYFFISWLLFQLDLGISYYFFFHDLATLATFS